MRTITAFFYFLPDKRNGLSIQYDPTGDITETQNYADENY